MANTPVQKNQSDVVAKDNVVDMSMFAADAGMGNKEINQESLSFYFNYGFSPEEETLIKSVKKVLPRNHIRQ